MGDSSTFRHSRNLNKNGLRAIRESSSPRVRDEGERGGGGENKREEERVREGGSALAQLFSSRAFLTFPWVGQRHLRVVELVGGVVGGVVAELLAGRVGGALEKVGDRPAISFE
jgi:hypothetical protein